VDRNVQRAQMKSVQKRETQQYPWRHVTALAVAFWCETVYAASPCTPICAPQCQPTCQNTPECFIECPADACCEHSCCTGTYHGQYRENCYDPANSKCCSGVGIPKEYRCCDDEDLNWPGPFSCPMDHECCDGFPGGPDESLCTPPTHKCCKFGDGTYVIADGECCADAPSSPPYYTCGSGETCCQGDCCAPDEACCEGQCAKKGACCFFDIGACSEETEFCCWDVLEGTFLGVGTTCTPGDLCMPECENCAGFSAVFYECGHISGTDDCDAASCIENLLSTATCERFPHRLGPPNCNTTTVPQPELVQNLYWVFVPEICSTTNPGGYHEWQTIHFGCGTSCLGGVYNVRCDTPMPCREPLVDSNDIGIKKACGCP
jgi:hypothetical protein